MAQKPTIRFVLFRSKKNKQHYFRIVSPNGKTIAQSEGYKRPANARGGIRAIAHGLNPKLRWADYAPKTT